MSVFQLHSQLDKDGIFVADLELCRLLLIKDANYPWCVLVPRRENKREIYELSEVDQLLLNKESTQLAKVMMDLFQGEKMNVAALGNMVPQLHIHHIVRYQKDLAWPGPVWGVAEATLYTDEKLEETIGKLRKTLEFS